MINKKSILIAAFIIVSLIMLYLCNKNVNENFENRLRGENYYNSNWRNNRYARYVNTGCKKNKRKLVATNPIHDMTEHFSIGDKIKGLFNTPDSIKSTDQNLPPFVPTKTNEKYEFSF